MWPVSRYAAPDTGPSPVGSAQVVLARTSEPPCFSVMPIPQSAPSFSATGSSAGRYEREASRGSQTAASSGWWRSRRRRIGHRHRTAVTGLDLAPDDEPDRAAQVRPVPGGRVHGSAVRPFATAVPRREWYAGGSRPHPRARRSVGGSAAAAVAVGVVGPALRGGRSGDTAQRVQAVGVRRVPQRSTASSRTGRRAEGRSPGGAGPGWSPRASPRGDRNESQSSLQSPCHRTGSP